MVLMGTNYGVYNQQQTQYYNNNAYNNSNYNRSPNTYNNVNKNYFQGIEKTSSRAYFQYNYQTSQSNQNSAAYYQTSQTNMYPQAAQSPHSVQPPKKVINTNEQNQTGVRLSKSKTLSKSFKYKKAKESQKLFVVRHGERVDTTFGSGWIQNAFDSNRNYIRFNLNMPKTLPAREDPTDFDFDPPLTEIGLLQAKLHGEELASKGIKITHVYSSPALRSIQTADKILEGMNLKDTVPIRIETGLFELMSWQNFIPNKYPFMEADTLKSAGYNIDFSYYPVVPYEFIRPNENEDTYYQRSHFMTKQIVNRHYTLGENIMFVGHAPTIEGCTRQLIGGKPRSTEDFIRINRKVPFLSIAQCERNNSTGNWSLVQPLIAPMRHSQLEEFNYNDLGAKTIDKTSDDDDDDDYPDQILF